jgi:hypothetical protein
MSKRFNGTIEIDGRDSTPDWQPYVQPVAPQGSPSVLYIVLDSELRYFRVVSVSACYSPLRR